MSEKYTKEHEWIRADGETALVGITDYAQSQLGDIIFVELPETGAKLSKDGDMAVVESVKAASEVYAPLDCEVVEINSALEAEPALVNQSPQADGWFVRVKLNNPDELNELMDKAAYDDFVSNLD
ncbi:MAG: glycine cleavage system protein GcvH [Pseudomonadota bacterium]